MRAAALVAYCGISFLYFGIRVVAHPGSGYVGTGADPQTSIWMLAWWPHAILHGENPIVTHAIWAPDGANLAWIASIPALGLAFAPLTLAAGPVVAHNVAAVLMPALAAWCAFLLCRYLTRSTWASLAAGYLFGFSSYVLGQELAHLNLTPVFPLPLVALVVVRHVRGELSGRAFALRLGVLVAVLFLCSTELAFTATLALVGGLALAALLRLGVERGIAVPVVGAYVVAAVLTAPFVYFALTGFETDSINDPAGWSADLANFVVPTRVTAVGTEWSRSVSAGFAGNDFERGAYLGLPLLAIVAWFAVTEWRSRRGRFLLASLLIAAFCALGPALVVAGHRIVTLPWRLLTSLPAFQHALPVRFSAYVALAAAVIAALWLASPRVPRALRIAGGVLAIAAIVPNLALGEWHTTPAQPRFVTAKLYRDCLRPSDNVLVLPYDSNGESMLWQAESGFAFRQSGGYVGPKPRKAFRRFPAVNALFQNTVPPHGAADVRAFARAKGIDAIVVDAAHADPWRRLLRPFGPPVEVGGVLVYDLGGSGPRCR